MIKDVPMFVLLLSTAYYAYRIYNNSYVKSILPGMTTDFVSFMLWILSDVLLVITCTVKVFIVQSSWCYSYFVKTSPDSLAIYGFIAIQAKGKWNMAFWGY